MKLFFLTAPIALEQSKLLIEVIKNLSKENNFQVVFGHEIGASISDLNSMNKTQLQKYYIDYVKQIKSCEALILEGTHPSTGGGHIVTIALQSHIPVLYLNQFKYSGPLLADQNRLLKLETYNPEDIAEIKKIILNFIKFLKNKRLTIRFNLMIDESMNNFIDYNSKELEISKADYIRTLIQEKMENINS